MESKKIRNTYKPEYAQMLIDHMAQGRTFSTFAAAINVPTSTLYLWLRTKNKFKQAHEIAVEAYNEYYENMIRLSIMGIVPDSLKVKGSKFINGRLALSFLKNTEPKKYNDKPNDDGGRKEMVINIDADDANL